MAHKARRSSARRGGKSGSGSKTDSGANRCSGPASSSARTYNAPAYRSARADGARALAVERTDTDGARIRRSLAVAYLNAVIDDADQEELMAALGRIARASGGPKLAEKVELNAGTLYRTLCRRGNPDLKSAATLLKAMGMRLMLQPLGELTR